MKTLALEVVTPRFACRLQERKRAYDIIVRKDHWGTYRPINMALGGKVHHAIDAILFEDPFNELPVGYVALNEGVVRTCQDVLYVGYVARVGEFVEREDVVVGVLLHKVSYNMATDKAGTTGNQYIALFHIWLWLMLPLNHFNTLC